jgi:protein-tyrosine phosphatase
MTNKIVFVCEGNICRSPMAAGLFASRLPHANVASAGLAPLLGRGADPLAVELMAARNVDISSHVAMRLSLEHIRLARLVLAMTQAQRKAIESMYPFSKGKVFRIAEHFDLDVADPYRQGRSAFSAALEQIELGVASWLDTLIRLNF